MVVGGAQAQSPRHLGCGLCLVGLWGLDVCVCVFGTSVGEGVGITMCTAAMDEISVPSWRIVVGGGCFGLSAWASGKGVWCRICFSDPDPSRIAV
jgi:hypothetical protein